MTDEPNVYRAVLIYISPTEYEGKPDHLKEFITQNKMTETWWNYVPFLYAVTTKYSVKNWRDGISKFVGEHTDVIVAEVDPRSVVGRVNPGGWAAFHKDIRDRLDELKAGA